MVQSVQESEINTWKQRLRYRPIRAGLLVLDEIYILQYYTPSGIEERIVDRESLYLELTKQDSDLFKPKALAEFRSGQLTLADIEESVSVNSLSFLLRQRKELDQAFQEAIQGVLAEIGVPTKRNQKNHISFRHEIAGHGIRVAIAFLAARILEDKGFFGSESHIPTDDPRLLLNLTVPRANGFFKKALEESIPHLNDRILQHLGANLGSRVSFALVDHRDVGLLYERAIKELPSDIEGGQWTDLQRHYTPIAIAERMLELLPLERLRPEERIIFDPAAGSGSLLLAATSRLAGMSDIPENLEERKSYLANHVVGNDLDQYANFVTQLRYTLARESLGQDIPFLFPKHFTHKNYNDLNKENMGIKPRVIIANPPFGKDGNTQHAAKFIEKALNWLEKGSQFAFILPQSFLASTTHGIPNARNLLTDNCQKAGKHDRKYDVCQEWEEWERLSYEEQKLWLLGILSSKIAGELSLKGRSSRGITRDLLYQLPLPFKVDYRIIEIIRQIVERDQKRLEIPDPDELRIKLNEIVEESYGNPHWIEIKRTGEPPELELWKSEQTKSTLTVIGQVLEISQDNTQILLYLSGLLDDEEEAWLPILPEMPGWALDGTVFEAELSEDVETFEQLSAHPWTIRRFRHTPYPYLTNEELKQKLRIDSMEERL